MERAEPRRVRFYLTPGLGQDEARIAYVLVADDLRKSVEILRKGIAAWSET